MASITTDTGDRARASLPPGVRLRRFLNREGVAGWLFILPVVIGVSIFTYAALIYSFYLSLTDWDLLRPPKWTGMSNYHTLLTRDEEFFKALRNTLFFVVTLVPVGIAAAMSMAILLNRKIKGIGFFRAAYYMPHITSTIAIGMVWIWMFNPDVGLINTALKVIGVSHPPDWLSSVHWSKPALLIMRIWQVTGYYMILYIAGLQTIPDELYEAASIDGATSWHKARYITVPLLANTTFFVTIMLTIESFNIFEAVFAMTEGGPGGSTNTLLYYIYTEAFKSYRMGYASAISWVLFVIIFCLTLVQFSLRRRKERDRM
ncbi:multiple sugar transport system permease protein [Paenibacillus sp. UNCCL117]|uniref:carbohydrate ABC transporter permease n=1 Tax=unclassified Paenibacillus TaxID=185978 RepID=UPI0008839FF7|nr:MULTISPECIES: sugar ABC transporter permease [unclassified Paenibacillus]SDE49097.1 carbohydrate ABC transporter membrane protein 1, CUT1 family [Paenibacillus sp. cl123]SFW66809.1 multiple sugar transport system permease protein [Paenibacillus sp. UNCCL117]